MGVETEVLMGTKAIMEFGQGQMNSDAIGSQNRISEMQNEFQREILEGKKEEIRDQAKEAAKSRQLELRSMLGSQRVAMASQGIQVEGELGAALERDARSTAQADVKAIKNNAWKQAMGIEMDQTSLELQSQYDKLSSEVRAEDAKNQGISNAVNTGIQAYNIYSKKK